MSSVRAYAPPSGQEVVQQQLSVAARRLWATVDIQDTLTNLGDLPERIREQSLGIARADAALVDLRRVRLVEAKSDLDLAFLDASARAPQDGSNAEKRKRQLDAFLASDLAYQTALAEVRAVELAVAQAEQDIALMKVERDALENRLRATCQTVAFLTETLHVFNPFVN